jgi:hypothetical protein
MKTGYLWGGCTAYNLTARGIIINRSISTKASKAHAENVGAFIYYEDKLADVNATSWNFHFDEEKLESELTINWGEKEFKIASKYRPNQYVASYDLFSTYASVVYADGKIIRTNMNYGVVYKGDFYFGDDSLCNALINIHAVAEYKPRSDGSEYYWPTDNGKIDKRVLADGVEMQVQYVYEEVWPEDWEQEPEMTKAAYVQYLLDTGWGDHLVLYDSSGYKVSKRYTEEEVREYLADGAPDFMDWRSFNKWWVEEYSELKRPEYSSDWRNLYNGEWLKGYFTTLGLDYAEHLKDKAAQRALENPYNGNPWCLEILEKYGLAE